ncbi:MAG: hypothetical protein EHM52_06205 [Actinomycetota bacterium]|nr:MAG: hypothetical protein EHM52_06205 [Actinomycetota bacterium]
MNSLNTNSFEENSNDALGISQPVLKVIGLGGGGCNAVNRMITEGIKGVEFIAVNTDGQALRASLAGVRLQLITPSGRGKALGAGCDPEAAPKAALDRTDELIECLEGADMVFIAAGMGGGTGTGAAPVIGSLARDAGALTVAVVTKPFGFEGTRKARIADKGIEELRSCVDTLIAVPNSRLLQMLGPGVSVQDAFKLADEALRHGVQGISDIINETGIINRDFADVETVMKGGGHGADGDRRRRGRAPRHRGGAAGVLLTAPRGDLAGGRPARAGQLRRRAGHHDHRDQRGRRAGLQALRPRRAVPLRLRAA